MRLVFYIIDEGYEVMPIRCYHIKYATHLSCLLKTKLLKKEQVLFIQMMNLR